MLMKGPRSPCKTLRLQSLPPVVGVERVVGLECPLETKEGRTFTKERVWEGGVEGLLENRDYCICLAVLL